MWPGGHDLFVLRTEGTLVNTNMRTFTDAAADEIENLRGTWKQVGYARDGMTSPLDEQGWEPRVSFTGHTFVVTLADGSVPIAGTYNLDPTQDPKTINWSDTIGEDAGKTLLAIYTLDQDRFVFCAANPGQERPCEFKAHAGQVL